MRTTALHWTDGPWQGRLALAARPRGGEWLEDEIAGWRREGVDVVVSLLTVEEECDLDIEAEEVIAKSHNMGFLRFAIRDRETPESTNDFLQFLDRVEGELASGRNVVLHCRQGIGRTGLFAACLLIANGVDPAEAAHRLSEARGLLVPETPEQMRWIQGFADSRR